MQQYDLNDERQLRAWCIETAISADLEGALKENAQKIYDFVKGTNDADIIRAARELAEKISPVPISPKS